MTIKKSKARKYLNKITKKPLTFGALIESIRKCDEMSQVAMAEKLKISRSHLCDIEKGRRLVSAERAAHFAKVLGFSVNQFVALAIEDSLHKLGLNLKVTIEAA